MKKRSSVVKLRQEKKDIILFVTAYLKIAPNESVFISDIFASYKKWRRLGHKEPSILSIDGFGKMFPNGYHRNVIYIEGSIGRGLKGFKLVH